MSKMQNKTASQAATSTVVASILSTPAPHAKAAPDAPKLTMVSDNVEAFAQETVNAFVVHDRAVAKAARTKLESVVDAAAYLPTALTAADWERLVGRAFRSELAVQVKRGKLTQGSAAKVGSQVKTVTLALANGWKVPEGAGFGPAYEEAVKALKGPSFAHVWGEGPKQGAPAGTVSKAKKEPKPGAAATTPTVTEAREELTMEVAALMVCNGNAARAAKLQVIMGSFAAEFDKWAETIITA